MRDKRRTILGLAALVVGLAVAWPAAGQVSGPEETFIDGLEKRGLLKLLEQYLADKEKSGSDALGIKERQARIFEMQGNRASAENDRDELFGKAKRKYRELLDELDQAMKAAPDDRTRDDLHMRILNLKIRMAEMIWQHEAFNQLNNLEITDRQRGDRAKVERLLREAHGLFKDVNTDVTAWQQEMEKSPDFEKRYQGSGHYDKTFQNKNYSHYQLAWTSYYLAYSLPETSKERETLLKDAVEKFTGFTHEEEDIQAKWESYKGLGMCSREQGMFDQAVENLRKALSSQNQKFNITVYYELAQTYLRAKKYVEARSVLTELVSKDLPEMSESFIGQTLLPFLDAKIALAEGQTNESQREYALKVMEDLWGRGEFWHQLISAELGKYINRSKPDALKPFEVRVLASDTYLKGATEDAAKNYAEAGKHYTEAAQFFERYLQLTPPADRSYAEALFNLAACYYKLAESPEAKAEARAELYDKAANRFREVVAKFPGSPSAARASDANVLIMSERFKELPTDKNLEEYEKALKKRLESRTLSPAEVADTHWLLANVLKKQGDHLEAAQHYAQVTADSTNYFDAKFEEADCYRADLVELKWTAASNEDLKRLVETTVAKMEGYAKWAQQTAAKSELETAKKLKGSGAQMLVSAAEIMAQDRVQQYERGLRLLDQFEKDFPDQQQLEGDALKVRIDCLYGQGQLAQAAALLDRLMQKPGQDVGPILQRMFGAITDEIDRLIRQSRNPEAADRLKRADDIGDKFISYLGRKGNTKDVPAIDYQLAELHRRAEDLDGEKGAVRRFLGLISYDPYDNRAEMEKKGLDLAYLAGLAQSTQALALKLARSKPERAYDLFKRAEFYWLNVAEGYGKPDRGQDAEEWQRRFWDAKYNQLGVCCYELNDLEKKFNTASPTDYFDVIRRFIIANRATNSAFGGPAMKILFDRLAQKVGL